MSAWQPAQFARVQTHSTILIGNRMRRWTQGRGNIDNRADLNRFDSSNRFADEAFGQTASVDLGGSFRGRSTAFIRLSDAQYGVGVSTRASITSRDLT